MAIQISTIREAFERHKEEIPDVDTDLFVQWSKYIYNFVYHYLKGVDPGRFMASEAYYALTDTHSIILPDDFMDISQSGCGFFPYDNAQLNYDGQTVNFTGSEILTGGTSGATAIIVTDTDSGVSGVLKLRKIDGSFQDNEPLTGDQGGAAVVNGDVDYIISDRQKLTQISFGQNGRGYYFERNKALLKCVKDKSILLRYMPQPVLIDDEDQYFTLDGTASGQVLIEDRHEEYLIRAYDLAYNDWDQNRGEEGISDQKMVRALGEVLSGYNRAPAVPQMINPNYYY